ncbi:hypothetical protein, partial [Microbacterium sp. NPDC055357]
MRADYGDVPATAPYPNLLDDLSDESASLVRVSEQRTKTGLLHGEVTVPSHAASATVVFMMVSNSMGVNRPS